MAATNGNRAPDGVNAEEGQKGDNIQKPDTTSTTNGEHDVLAAPPPTAGRITVALVKKAVEDLEKARQTTGYSKTDIVNRAISMYAFVEEEIAGGAEFLIRREDGTQYLLKSY